MEVQITFNLDDEKIQKVVEKKITDALNEADSNNKIADSIGRELVRYIEQDFESFESIDSALSKYMVKLLNQKLGSQK